MGSLFFHVHELELYPLKNKVGPKNGGPRKHLIKTKA